MGESLEHKFAVERETNELAERNFNKIATALTKKGYVEGVSDGRNHIMQEAFDQGYRDAFAKNFTISKWKNILALMSENETKLTDELRQAVKLTEKTNFLHEQRTDKMPSVNGNQLNCNRVSDIKSDESFKKEFEIIDKFLA